MSGPLSAAVESSALSRWRREAPTLWAFPFILILQSTPLAFFVRQTAWSWPVLESLHFLGMALLGGTVGIFDLRLLGYASARGLE